LGGRSEGYEKHPGGGERAEYEDSKGIWDSVDEVWSYEFGEEGWEDICEKNDCLGYIWTDEIKGRREYDNVQNIVNEAYDIVRQVRWQRRRS
jgi:hypothetical protein